MAILQIGEMFAGRVQSFGRDGKTSAILKQAIAGPWQISETGLIGDEQADARHHGGPEKALHQYCFDHYPVWRAELPSAERALERAPAFGENISAPGLSEADVCVGDVFEAGSVTLQISQGRQPCWKLNTRFDVPDMAKRVQQTGRTGWYYRVLEPGTIEPGDGLILIDRPRPDWTIAGIAELLYHRPKAFAELEALANVSELAEGWRILARRRVERRSVEDWTARLQG